MQTFLAQIIAKNRFLRKKRTSDAARNDRRDTYKQSTGTGYNIKQPRKGTVFSMNKQTFLDELGAHLAALGADRMVVAAQKAKMDAYLRSKNMENVDVDPAKMAEGIMEKLKSEAADRAAEQAHGDAPADRQAEPPKAPAAQHRQVPMPDKAREEAVKAAARHAEETPAPPRHRRPQRRPHAVPTLPPMPHLTPQDRSPPHIPRHSSSARRATVQSPRAHVPHRHGAIPIPSPIPNTTRAQSSAPRSVKRSLSSKR